jgi:hypothetical protein
LGCTSKFDCSDIREPILSEKNGKLAPVSEQTENILVWWAGVNGMHNLSAGSFSETLILIFCEAWFRVLCSVEMGILLVAKTGQGSSGGDKWVSV